MKRNAAKPFQPKSYLGSFNGGKTVADYPKGKIVFAQAPHAVYIGAEGTSIATPAAGPK